jgi:S-DNA-T family DNA segregation ATPase FtsK/SpoIIIE
MYEPVIQRVRELGTPGLVMSGSKDEGVLLGDVKCAPQPPGRGNLVRRRAATSLVQVGWCG